VELFTITGEMMIMSINININMESWNAMIMSIMLFLRQIKKNISKWINNKKINFWKISKEKVPQDI